MKRIFVCTERDSERLRETEPELPGIVIAFSKIQHIVHENPHAPQTLLTNDELFYLPSVIIRFPVMGRNGSGSGGASSIRIRAIRLAYPLGVAHVPPPTISILPIHDNVVVVDKRTKTVNFCATVLVAASD